MENKEQLALALRGIKKSFGDVEVLKNVDFSLRKGEIHALVGENGAGKSTLIKGTIGVHSFDSGKIFLDGQEVKFRNASEAAAQGISVVFQELSQVETLSVAENIFLCREGTKLLAPMNRKSMYLKAGELLAEYGLDIDPSTPVDRLIVAKRQFLEIIKAVSRNSRILVLDEPTAALTVAESEQLFEILQRLKSQGTSIIYISHRMNEVFRLADRITILRDGINVFESDTADVDFDRVVKEMVGRELDLYDASKKREHRTVDGEPVLIVDRLCRKGEFDNISFSVKAGEVLGFAGLVGSGRSELMQVLFGINKASSGKVTLNGCDITNLKTNRIIQAGLSMVPENRHIQGLSLVHSVEDNISITTLKQLSWGIQVLRKRVRQLAETMIERFNIRTDSPKKTVSLLSGGNQQKIVLSKWIATNPKVLILDEPTCGIDVQAKTEIHRLIADLADAGTAILLISSELSELINNSDRILVLNENRIIGQLGTDASQENIMEIIMKDKAERKANGGQVV